MRLTHLDMFFWAAGFVLNVVLLSVLVYRRRYARFPFFTGIIALGVARTLLLYALRSRGQDRWYAVTFWTLAVVDILLQFGVVYEVASQIFRSSALVAGNVRRNAWWLGALLAGALTLTVLASPPTGTAIGVLTTRGYLFAAALMSELFVAILAVSLTSGMPWKPHVGAIAQGLGAYSLLSVLVEGGHAYFGVGRAVMAFVVLSQLRMLAYLGCVVYWTVSTEPGRSARAHPTRSDARDPAYHTQ